MALSDQSEPAGRGGWSNLGGQARKWHWFDMNEAGAVAACGKWALRRPDPNMQDDVGVSPEDCAACRKKHPIAGMIELVVVIPPPVGGGIA